MVRDGVVMTPAANRTFLAGITRARVIALLRQSGFDVMETTLSVQDFLAADEVFMTGNYSKVMPVSRLDGRDYQEGPVTRKALELYMEWAHSSVDA
jgi:branched-chain amino acid aminotransferase